MKYRIGAVIDDKQLAKVAELLGSSGFSCTPFLSADNVYRPLERGRRGRKSTVRPFILETLSTGPKHISEIREAFDTAGFSVSSCDNMCGSLRREGLITSDGNGIWSLVGQANRPDENDPAQLPS